MSDAAAVAVLVLLMLAVALLARPSLLWLRANALAGFWSTPDGVLYEVCATGSRTFSVQPSASRAVQRGEVRGLRTVAVGCRLGSLSADKRTLRWDAASAASDWTRQGV